MIFKILRNKCSRAIMVGMYDFNKEAKFTKIVNNFSYNETDS